MNHKKLPLIAGTLALLFCGCAGQNHVLFMTKSNAGLDFDSKPPTLEISVSRKEVVIAPTFEGGQMPPVAASFKPRAGAGSGFGNFFLGVDQTFEGGDAAMAMAALYSSDQTPAPASRTDYNSALTLTQPPRSTSSWRRVPGPGETRTFIFGTDTTLGLKVAWSGTGGQFPDTVRLGFNRKEFAWAPVFIATNPPATTNAAVAYSVKMPSFLATIQSHIQAGTSNSGVFALQYFAAGETATLLALQPAVREAMIKRLDPVAAELSPEFVQGRVAYKDSQTKADEIVAYARTADGKLDPAKIDILLKNTNLPAAEVKQMKADQFRQKLARSWSLDVDSIYKNKPDQ